MYSTETARVYARVCCVVHLPELEHSHVRVHVGGRPDSACVPLIQEGRASESKIHSGSQPQGCPQLK